MKTKTTRRAIMAGLAVAPVVGLPAFAGAASGDDPAITAIAEYQRCRAAWEAAAEAASRRAKDARAALGVITYQGKQICRMEQLEAMRSQTRVPSEAEEEEFIERLRKGFAMQRAEASAAGPDFEYDAAKAALEARLPSRDDNEDDAQEAAWSALEEAELGIFEVAPSTRSGAAALLRFAADKLDEIQINDTLLADVFTNAIRNAVTVLEQEARS